MNHEIDICFSKRIFGLKCASSELNRHQTFDFPVKISQMLHYDEIKLVWVQVHPVECQSLNGVKNHGNENPLHPIKSDANTLKLQNARVMRESTECWNLIKVHAQIPLLVMIFSTRVIN